MDPVPGELFVEGLPGCEWDVPKADLINTEDCGEPPVCRGTWDGGETWLRLCREHYRQAEREAAARPRA